MVPLLTHTILVITPMISITRNFTLHFAIIFNLYQETISARPQMRARHENVAGLINFLRSGAVGPTMRSGRTSTQEI